MATINSFVIIEKIIIIDAVSTAAISVPFVTFDGQGGKDTGALGAATIFVGFKVGLVVVVCVVVAVVCVVNVGKST